VKRSQGSDVPGQRERQRQARRAAKLAEREERRRRRREAGGDPDPADVAPWLLEAVEPLGHLGDVTVARQLGVRVGPVRAARAELARRAGRA
jgi:hypothetical protein